jgi:hypothetical protein
MKWPENWMKSLDSIDGLSLALPLGAQYTFDILIHGVSMRNKVLMMRNKGATLDLSFYGKLLLWYFNKFVPFTEYVPTNRHQSYLCFILLVLSRISTVGHEAIVIKRWGSEED